MKTVRLPTAEEKITAPRFLNKLFCPPKVQPPEQQLKHPSPEQSVKTPLLGPE